MIDDLFSALVDLVQETGILLYACLFWATMAAYEVSDDGYILGTL
jgi:hypothetical protein